MTSARREKLDNQFLTSFQIYEKNSDSQNL